MLQRTSLWVVVLGLALVLGGTQLADAGANDPAWITAANGTADGSWPTAGFEGLPDLDRSSAKYLVMNGLRDATNQSLSGESVNADRHTFRLTFTSDDANVRIALFDADTTGLWDQAPDGVILRFPPRIRYELYADKDGLATTTVNDPAFDSTDPAQAAFVAQRQILSIDSNDPSLAGSDNKWCALYDQAFNSALHAEGVDVDGNVNIVFHARVIPFMDAAPDAPSSPMTRLGGTERVGYKLAYNGTYILPAGAVLGFGGGAIDERYPVGAGDDSNTLLDAETLDPWRENPGDPQPTIPGTPFTNQYDGVFVFPIHYTHACAGDIPFNEADADWDADPNVTKTLGVPSDNGQPHDITIPADSSKRPVPYIPPVFPLHDNTVFAVGNPIEWMFYPANPGNLNPTDAGFGALTLPFWSSNAIAGRQPMSNGWLDHASVNVFQQDLVFHNSDYNAAPPFANLAAALAAPDSALLQEGSTCWQRVDFAQATVLGQKGIWNMRWAGVDASNFVFMRFGTNVGTTPRKVTLEGNLYCDDNNNNVFDSTEATVDGGNPAGTRWNINLQRVGPAPTNTPVGPVIVVPVNAAGAWSSMVTTGRYSITAVPGVGATETPRGPIFLDVEADPPECKVNQDVPVDCKKGTICGIVYCSDNWTPGVPVPPYNAITDTPLNGATVTLTGPAPSTATQTFITGVTLDNMGQLLGDGKYCFYDLEPGSYTVAITAPPTPPAGTFFESLLSSPEFYQVTIQGSETVDDRDFGYCCSPDPCKIKGRVWCDDDMDGVYDAGEPPLTAADGYTVVITDVNNAANTWSPVIDTGGMYMQEVPPGTYTVDLFYLGTKNFPPNVAIPGGDQKTVTCPEPDGDTPQPDLTADFPVKCLGEICGWVFCQREICDGVRRPGDVPLNGATVTLTGPAGPMSQVQTFTTGVTIDSETGQLLADGRYCFRKLIPGTYTVAITTPPTPPPGEQFVGPPPAPHVVQVAAFQEVDEKNFAYCCKPKTTDICVCVWCDEDCDGIRDEGELLGVAGVKYTLLDAQGNTVGMHTSTVDPNGLIEEYCFTNIPLGNYTVRVDIVPAGLSPTTPQVVQVVARAAPAKVWFGYCKPGEICGKVWLDGKDEKGNCDGVFNEKYDECLDGVKVELLDATGAVIDMTTTGTDGQGNPPFTGQYCFRNLEPGQYTVRLPAPFNITRRLTLASGQSVDLGVVSGQTSEANFYFTAQAVTGRVWCEPSEEECDGKFTRGVDTPIEGVEMLLTGTGGDALGLVETALTGANGRFKFEDVPTGSYELRVSDNPVNAVLLKDKIAKGKKIKTFTVDICECPHKRFPYCPCEQDICVKVFKERGKDCDGKFDKGIDKCLEWIEVFVTHKGNNQTYIANGWTDEHGKFCFKGLPPGEYWVYVGANQDRLYGLKPCDFDPKNPCPITTVVLKPCEDEYVKFCYCEPCPPKECCEGKVHEVVFDAKVWVGDCVSDHWGASAHLQISCKPGAGVYGEAWGDWYGAFPGPIKGLDGVVTIEDLWYLDGIATVRVRLKATGPELRGWFPDEKLRLTVFVNGKKVTACLKLRCETVRPGAVFPWTKKCPPQPECNEDHKFVFKRYSDWRWCDCMAPFFVRHTLSYESWRHCNPCEPVRKHKDVVVEYKCDDCVEDHVYMVKLKEGRKVLDQIKVEFWGDEWSGPIRGENGHLALIKVWQGEHGKWYAKLRIHYKCGCDYHPPEWLKVWSKIDSCAKDKRVYLECKTPKLVPSGDDD